MIVFFNYLHCYQRVVSVILMTMLRIHIFGTYVKRDGRDRAGIIYRYILVLLLTKNYRVELCHFQNLFLHILPVVFHININETRVEGMAEERRELFSRFLVMIYGNYCQAELFTTSPTLFFLSTSCLFFSY